MLVVPPNAAARVPVSKSSAEVVPPNGMSRCVCTSIPPGITYIPAASITLAAAASGIPARTSLITAPSIRTSALAVVRAVTTVPFRIKVFIAMSSPGSLPRSLPRSLRPTLLPAPRLHLLHRDAFFHRANQPAQVATHAFLFIDPRDPHRLGRDICRGLPRIQLGNRRHHNPRPASRLQVRRKRMPVQMDALMRAIPARDVAEIAANALVAIDPRYDLVVQIQVLPIRDLRQRQPAKFLDGAESLFINPVAQPSGHVLHHAKAVVHGRRADLHRAAPHQDELRRLSPSRNSADP